MKNLKRVLALSLVGTLAFALASCSKDERNQQVPYGSVSTNVVASAGDYNINAKQLYDRLKYSYGYTVFTNKLNKIVYKDEINAFKYEGDNKITIDEAVANAVYGSTSIDSLKVLTDESKDESKRRYIDSIANQGIIIENSSILDFDSINNDTEHISFSNLPQEIIDFYAIDTIKKEANINYLKTVCDDTENDYYISPDDIENEYNSSYKDYNTSHGIVIRFASLGEANRYISKISGFDGKVDSYVALYNEYYNYKDEKLTTTTIDSNDDTTFIVNDEENTLGSISENVKSFFYDVLKDGEGLTTPRNIDGNYYLMYRHNVVYETSGNNETIEYKDLDEKLGADKTNEIKDICKEQIIEGNASSVNNQLFEDRLMDLGIVIYDPFIENTFANTYTDYQYATSFDNNLIFSTNTNDNYKVDDFYNDLTNYSINETVVTLLLNQYLYDLEMNNQDKINNGDYTYESYLEDDAESDLRETIDNGIKSFNKGEAGLNKAYGESNYLYYTYGYYTIEEIVKNNLAVDIQTAYLADYIYNNWANKEHQIDTDNLGILHNLLNTALAIYNEHDYLDLNIDHILISIDNNGDGEPDDMDLFLADLSDSEKANFTTAINNLATTIIKEANAISDHTNVDKLNYIVTAFNRNYELHDGTHWDDYKTYNFILTAESLGDVTNSSVTSYVEPFQDYLYALYDKAVELELDIPEDDFDGIFYSPNGEVNSDNYVGINLDNAEDSYSSLCQTNFGFHLISLNSYDEEDNNTLDFKMVKDDDDDYGDIRLVLDELDEDDENDDIYITTDTYNDDSSKPNDKQLLVYYVEYTKDDVSSFRTSVENDLSDLLDAVIDKFQTSNVQKYFLIGSLGTITANNLGHFNYEFYMQYLANQAEDYDINSDYLSWYDLTNIASWKR